MTQAMELDFSLSFSDLSDILYVPDLGRDGMLPLSMPQTPGLEEHNDMSSANATVENTFSSYDTFFIGPGEQQLLSHQSSDYMGALTPVPDQSPNLFAGHYDEDSNMWKGSTDTSSSRDQINEVVESAIPQHSVNTKQHLSRISPRQVISSRRKQRKQNHSCDPCRAAKRACGLRASIPIHSKKALEPCSMCIVRGVECTVTWLRSRQPSLYPDQRARADSSLVEGNKPLDEASDIGTRNGAGTSPSDDVVSISRAEDDLARGFTARETCSRQFNLYVDIFDMPMTRCISQRCMPPCYPLGAAALAPLSESTHLAVYFDQARSWIKSCWDTGSASTSWGSAAFAPHLFRTVSVLDALFKPTNRQPSLAATPSRNDSINETYKWVATAVAAQFTLSAGNHLDGAKSISQARDIACATWLKAKQMVFENLAARASFRLALSLLLFGIILPPTGVEESHAYKEDSAYIRCKGLRRLQKLCIQARAYLSKDYGPRIGPPSVDVHVAERNVDISPKVPHETLQHILELIGAIEWLVTMTNAVAIVTTKGRICAISPDLHSPYLGGLTMMGDTAQGLDTERSIHARRLDDSIVTRSKAEAEAVTALWRPGTADDIVFYAVNRSGSLVVLLLKSLASFIMATQSSSWNEAVYEKIHRTTRQPLNSSISGDRPLAHSPVRPS